MSLQKKAHYSYLFLFPAAFIFFLFFLIPAFSSFFFSLTRWTLTDWTFIGLENYKMFFAEDSLSIGFKNTFIYAFLTCSLKVIIGMGLAVYLTSSIRTRNFLRAVVFFPHLISTIAVGITFSSLMHPTKGVINTFLSIIGIPGPDWLGNIQIALLSVIAVDVWKGVGVATVILIAGIMSIPEQYYEALQIDGGGNMAKFFHITLPLSRPAINSVIILALIGGLRTFDLVWSMTKGGPGFTTDLLSSIIYKQYSSGFFGLSTAGNVNLFILVSVISFPVYKYLNSREVDL
ncbi:sugar ABC transporter permease [Marispirochaeta sp.]|uniref:carbohydrate ABC transporter permease n=1 Tax=Marispirochaeta sp. TaxID=2038653 RepID=UPI0029C6367A|nr:sugar ABC transporter permease [Marispirochaeta sp.]